MNIPTALYQHTLSRWPILKIGNESLSFLLALIALGVSIYLQSPYAAAAAILAVVLKIHPMHIDACLAQEEHPAPTSTDADPSWMRTLKVVDVVRWLLLAGAVLALVFQ